MEERRGNLCTSELLVTIVDVNTFIGRYPYRDAGADAGELASELERVGVDRAWVSHLSAVFWRDPSAGNDALYDITAANPMFAPVVAVHPGLPGWQSVVDEANERGAVAVRCDPTFYGLAPAGGGVMALARAAGERRLPMLMAVRLEDVRQRHPNDRVEDLPAWAVRQIVRGATDARLVVTHADREFIEQVHFGLTPNEAHRVLWDISWIWGPPEDHLATLLETVGVERFTFGSGFPLRLAETPIAKLDLLAAAAATRAAIESENLQRFIAFD